MNNAEKKLDVGNSFISWIGIQLPNVKRILVKKYFTTGMKDCIKLLLTLLLGMMIETIFYKRNLNEFLRQIVLYSILFAINNFLGRKVASESKKLQKEVYGNLCGLLYKKEIRAKGKDLQIIDSGENLQLFTQDIENVFICLDQGIENIATSIVGMTGIFIIVSFYSFPLALVILIFAIVTVSLTNFSNNKYQDERERFREKERFYINWINEHLKGMRDIHINRAEKMYQKIFDKHTKENLRAKEKIRFIEIKAERAIGFVFTIFTVLFWAASAIIILDTSLTVGFFYVVNKYFSNMMNYLSIVLQEELNIRKYIPGFKKIRICCELEDENERQGSGEGLISLRNTEAILRFKTVSFSYENVSVINSMNLEFEAGKMNVIVGANGVGKTTIMNLILRLYEVDDGSIEYNGVDIRRYCLNEWRQCISYVQQDNLIFEGSLKDNILLFAPDISENQIWDAVKIAGLYNTVMEWEDKLETDIMKGERLSEGQKQRVAIARAFAKKSRIILMDEPTANLDYEVEKEIIADVKKMCKEQILIIITHRYTVAKQADQIVVVDDGNIQAQGKHDVLEKDSVCYKRLFEL